MTLYFKDKYQKIEFSYYEIAVLEALIERVAKEYTFLKNDLSHGEFFSMENVEDVLTIIKLAIEKQEEDIDDLKIERQKEAADDFYKQEVEQ